MESPIPPDPYKALGVPKDATQDEIKRSYRKLVLKCHPDKLAGITDETLLRRKSDEFTRVQEAYEILSDEKKRTHYENKLRLAELRKEKMQREAASTARNMGGYGSSTTAFEVRNNGQVYEERVPPARFFDSDDSNSRLFEEPRPRRAYDYEEPPLRTKRAVPEEKKQSRPVESDRYRSTKVQSRESERSGHYDRRKTRDKERRREATDKYSTRAVFAESDSEEGDIFDDHRHHRGRYDDSSSKRKEKYDDRKRDRYEDEYSSGSRRKETREPRESRESRRSREDRYEDDWREKHTTAADYIAQSRTKGGPVERDPFSKASLAYIDKISRHVEPRSSGRGMFVRESSKSRSSKDRHRSVDPYESRRSPPKDAPPVPPLRSNTDYERPSKSSRAEMPGLRRSETTPLAGMTSSRRSTEPSSKTSKLKTSTGNHDSGYSSPTSPDVHYTTTKPHKSTRYKVVDGEDYRNKIVVEDLPPPRHNIRMESPSPHRERERESHRSFERPSVSVRSSSKPTRSNSYAPDPSRYQSAFPDRNLDIPPIPPLPRQHSERIPPSSTSRPNPPPLSRGQSARGEIFGSPPAYKVRYAPVIRPEDVQYTSLRRGSEPLERRTQAAYVHLKPETLHQSSSRVY
ncbi:MAG: hypothetical protein M1834_009657 [Cirrosporium novae-zelandiae]|nr:MAG: hypothetical protein M1834_009657 [Cirrosporium novae-zelandiae]